MLLLYFLWRSRKDPAYRQRLPERFSLGLRKRGLQPGGIVVHAVSVGEVVAATPLIKALQQQYPQLTLTITCTTPTGSARIVSTFADSVYHCYLPLDTPGAVQRFLNKLQPQAVIVLETELWPNLLQQCRRALIPAIVVNARLSARSARGYRRYYAFSRLALDNISVLLAQDSATARRFKALGCKAQLSVCGNLKYDMAVPVHIDSLVAQFRPQLSGRKVWVAGSTHAGEDESVLAAHRLLLQQQPQALLILVPRHPERFASVQQLCVKEGFATCRRSLGEAPDAATQVLLGDTMGELLFLYALADSAFVGGSLVPNGGHNLLEPAALARPVLSGPHLFNFLEIATMLREAGAMCEVDEAQGLATEVRRLIELPRDALKMGEAGVAVMRANQGALQRLLDGLGNLLKV